MGVGLAEAPLRVGAPQGLVNPTLGQIDRGRASAHVPVEEGAAHGVPTRVVAKVSDHVVRSDGTLHCREVGCKARGALLVGEALDFDSTAKGNRVDPRCHSRTHSRHDS